MGPAQNLYCAALHNAPAVNWDALVVKISHVFQAVATGAYCPILEFENHKKTIFLMAGVPFRLTCSHPELTEDHVLTRAHVKIFRTVMRNAVNKSV